jgi:peptidoglycan hydrolase CwlO-like protein
VEQRTRTLAGVDSRLQQVLSKLTSITGIVDVLSGEMPTVQQQLSQLMQQQQQQQQGAGGAMPSWQGNMLAAAQQLEDIEAAIASMKQQLTDTSSMCNTSLVEFQEQQRQLAQQQQEQREQQRQLAQQQQEQREQQQRLQQQQQEQQQLLAQLQDQIKEQERQHEQQQQQQQPPARFMAHAPTSMGGGDLVATLAACGGITPGSITTARIVWFPRSDAAADDSGTAAASGSGTSSSGGASGAQRARRSMCLWEVTLKDADLLSNMLGGRIRSNLRQAGHSIYVDVVLNAEERQQRKAMQQLRRELQQQGVRTRWSGATLMRWRRGGADGRRGSREEVPPLPSEVPGSVV